MLKTLDKYILKQLILPFLFGFFLFVVVISIDPLIQALQNIINDNLPISIVLVWFLYRLPQDMIFTFPMSMLLTTLVVFGRMSKDSETVALKAGGINFFRILLPVVFFSIIVTIISFIFNEFVVPYSNRRANEIRKSQILRLSEPDATENSIMKASDGGFVYARKVYEKEGRMEKVLVEYYKNSKLYKRISAGEAKWNGKFWILYGVVEQQYKNSNVASPTFMPIYEAVGIKETPNDFARQSKRPSEMSYNELKSRIETYKRTGFMNTRELEVELALKTSLPFASFFFAIIGCAYGLTNYRSGAFIGFGVSIIIIFLYYILMSLFAALGKSGYLPVFLSAWLQNILFLIVGFRLVLKINS